MPEATALSIKSPLIHETFSNPVPMHLPALHRHALIVSATKKRTTGDSLCVFFNVIHLTFCSPDMHSWLP